MPNRNVVAIVVAILLAWVVAGCGVEVESQASRQLDVIGDVEVSTTICATMDSVDSAPGCSPLSSDHRARSLVGYRIPAGSRAPDELESTGDVRLSYVRDAGYGAYLDARYPSDGAHWVGYVSEVHEWAAGEAPRWTVAPRFSLPAAGSPHEGPFEYASVAGYFVPGDGAGDSAPPVCDEVACPDTAPILGSQPTNDLALVSGPSPGIAQNDEGDVPVGLRFAGPERDDARFELSASSDLPGAAVAPRDGSFAPPAGDAGSTSASTERVHVDVPGDARPGLYTVTLTARSGGQVRSGTTEFIVTEKVDPGVAVETATSHQLDVIGDVGIDAGFCTRPDPEVFISAVRPRVAGAADGGRAGCGASQSRQRTQALAAFRIPAGSSAPAALAASGDRDGEYVLDEAYGAGMDARFPPPDGQRWVGYVSSPHSTPAGQVEHWSVSPRFGLPEPGTPYRGPYPFAVASGYRDLAPGGAAGAPVDCAGPHTWCPGPEVVAGQATRDLGVLPGGDPPSIVSGSRGTVPFDLRFAGAAGGGAEFELAASTDLPRASVAVEGSRLVPATDSSNAEGVAVSV
ncbi:MAG: hypothetical protein QOG63_719, partial [Thermoleophilaceae bacterium]|nr:hypothetical protein [Thermoleophilaceae bacterium]